MRNVTVYGNKEVVIDGQLVSKVLAVNPPTRDKPIPSIELHIDGALTYTPEKYSPPPTMPMPAPEAVMRSQDVWQIYVNSYIDYETYKKIMAFYFPNHVPMKPLGQSPSMPMPPMPR